MGCAAAPNCSPVPLHPPPLYDYSLPYYIQASSTIKQMELLDSNFIAHHFLSSQTQFHKTLSTYPEDTAKA